MFVRVSPKQKKKFTTIFKPKFWQVKSIEWMIEKAAAGLFLAPGLGKTVCALAAFYILRNKGYVDKMLVIAKRRIIYQVWPQEIEKWNLPFTFAIVHGQSKDKHGKTKKLRALESDADIYLINYEALPWLMRQPRHVKKFVNGMLVCDESSMVKNWSASRTKTLKRLLPIFKRRYILSGSPTPNSIMDIFSQIFILDMGRSLGKYITDFRNEYFYTVGPKEWGQFALKELSCEQKIYKKIRHLVLRFSTDLLNLPPLIPLTRTVVLSPTARKIYNDIEQEFVAFIQNKTLTAANAGVASSKCRQIAGGNVYLPQEKDAQGRITKPYLTVHNEKILELQMLIAELRGLPCLVAYEFDHERKEIQKVLKCPHVGGGTTDREADKLLMQWNRGELPVLLGQPASIAHGLNLQGTKGAVIYYSCGWNFDDHDQFKRRLWRQGQKHKVLCYYLMTEDTIDDHVLSVLTLKGANQQKLFDALQRHYGNRQRTTTMKMTSNTRKKVTRKVKPAPVTKGRTRRYKPPPAVRLANGLRKGSQQAKLLALAQRKTGVTVADACKRLKVEAGTVRVTISALKAKGFKVTNDGGKYRAK